MKRSLNRTYASRLRACWWFAGLALPLLVMGCQDRSSSSRTPGPRMSPVRSDAPISRQPLLGISGLAWLRADTFLAVHDAKHPEEALAPRVSLITRSATGNGWTPVPLRVTWPTEAGPSSDLESVAPIPGTPDLLLVESGGGRKPVPHVYLARRSGATLRIRSAAAWPVPVTNVEGSAVAQVGDQLVFVFAERSAGQDSTALTWSALSADALHAGQLQWSTFQRVAVPNLAPTGAGARAVSDLAIDDRGRVYMTTAYDPNDDYGPFRSSVWVVGRLTHDDVGMPTIVLATPFCRQATLDGLKVEGLAVQHSTAAASSDQPTAHLFVGTDDEQLGAVFRPLPAASCSS